MKVKIELTLETGEHTGGTQEAIESTQNQLRTMDTEELIELMEYEVIYQ